MGYKSLNGVIKFVATLALGSRPRLRLAKVRVKSEFRSHISCFWECKKVGGMNPHTPK